MAAAPFGGIVVALLAAGGLGAAQPATGLPAEIIQLTQLGPALAVAVVAGCWPGRIRTLLAGRSASAVARVAAC